MKSYLIASLIGACLAATSVMANEAQPQETSKQQAAVIEKVSKDVAAAPEKAADIVKNTILESKADPQFVAQIVRAAILAAPQQIHEIYNAAIAAAPDATGLTNLMIAGMLGGDEVAAPDGPAKAKLKKALKSFLNTTDISVDSDNKGNKFLVSKEMLKNWALGSDGKGTTEVKLDNFTYLLNIGQSGSDASKYEVVILKKDSKMTPP